MVEIWGPHHGVKRIDATSAEQFIGATNHFTVPTMTPHAPYKMKHSDVRYNTITDRLKQAAPQITPDTMRGILSAPYPNGRHSAFHYFRCHRRYDRSVFRIAACEYVVRVRSVSTWQLRRISGHSPYRASCSGLLGMDSHCLIQSKSLSPLNRIHVNEILMLVEQKKYFVLHAPRQTGKTSSLLALQTYLNETGQYRCLYCNLEEVC